MSDNGDATQASALVAMQSTSNSESVLEEFKDNSDNRIVRAATTVFSTLGASLKHAMKTASMLYLRPAYLTSS